MLDFITRVYQQLQGTSAMELVAVIFAIAYLLLALRENSLCWYCAFASTMIYTWLFWDVSLLMESALNVYYMAMAVYGWHNWRQTSTNSEQKGPKVAITRWRVSHHLWAWGFILVLSLISGVLLSRNTTAVLPYIDSFTTWGSVLTTWMVARKILENWLYWIVIDGVSIFLYLDRGLYLTSLLFVAYVIIVVFGYFAWKRVWAKSLANKNV